jgi:predicted PurR-regulated permease PerM
VRLRWLLALGAWATGLILFLYFFDALRPVLLDLLFAAAIAAMLRPLLRWAPGPHWLRGLLVGLAFVLVVAGVLAGLGWLLQAPVKRELDQWPQLHQHLNDLLARWAQRLGLQETPDVQTAAQRLIASALGSGAGTHVLSSAADMLSQFLVTLALVFVGMIYLLLEPAGRLTRPLIAPLNRRRQAQLHKTFHDLDTRLRFWLIGVIVSTCLVGTLSWVGYYFVNLQFALPLAIFAGLAEIVPTVGALTASAVAILVAATQNSAFTFIGVIVVHSITLMIESYVILPLIMRRAILVPPAVMLFTVVLWAKLLGIGGLILALPLDLVVWTLYQNFVLPPPREQAREIHAGSG